jgi:hypothetical protein
LTSAVKILRHGFFRRKFLVFAEKFKTGTNSYFPASPNLEKKTRAISCL